MKPKIRKIVSLGLSVFINLFILMQSLLPSALSSSQSGLFSQPIIQIIEFFRPNTSKNIIPEKIEIVGESTVFLDQTTTYTVKFTPKDVSYPSVSWEVDNEFAVIDNKGNFAAKKTGEVVLTCTYLEDPAIKATKIINIVERPKVVPTELVIALNATEVLVNTSTPLSVNILPHNDFEVVYEISNDCIEIDEFNMIRVNKAGTVSLSAYIKHYPDIKSQSINLTCLDQTITPATGINISLNQVYVNRKEQPVINILPVDATDTNYILMSSDESIATIEDNKVLGKAKGNVNITVVHGYNRNIIKTTPINVEEVLPATIHLSYADSEQILIVGKTVQLRIQMSPSDITNQTIAWGTSDESIAKVDSNGLVYGIKEGTFTITATSLSNPLLNIAREYKVEKASSLGSYQRTLVGVIIRKGIGHFGLFAVSGLVTTWCLYEWLRATKKPLIISISSGFILGVIAEIVQQIPEGRAPGIGDIFINISGYVAGLFAYFILIKWSRKRKKRGKNKSSDL